jgi:hypothetical protein
MTTAASILASNQSAAQGGPFRPDSWSYLVPSNELALLTGVAPRPNWACQLDPPNRTIII